MKTMGYYVLICLILVAALSMPLSATAEEAGFTVAQFVTASDVVDREPVGVAEIFPSSTDTVYCYLDARDIAMDTEVSMVWYHEGDEAALITLLLKKSTRWRTWSSKQIAGRTGQWKVVLRDASGNDIKTAEFTVE